jgi:hypothetical protein
MTGLPTFAVVGHPNKGKSSIVATLAEDERVGIGPTPGTTRRAHRYTFRVDGEPQYVLVDTPGFQRARAVLDWLEERQAGAHTRPQLVADFVAEHRDDPRFVDECELLAPIVGGAGILYVVDGAKPYGAEYELEMQLLQWTGRPRMALINLIGPGDYVAEWRRALGQYFSIVREFDAVHADFAKRVALLRAFAELDESWRPALERAVAALETERTRRRERSAREIADLLMDAMTTTERRPLRAGAERGVQEAELLETLKARLRRREQTARDQVQSLYRHQHLKRTDAVEELLDAGLFAREEWELFGLSRTQLVLTGAVSGALAGGGVDALLGGASLLLGAGVGAVLGGAGVWFVGDELAKVKLLGQPLGGRVLQVGPVTAPNFPWVLLGRAWVHHHLVSERNHARREAMGVELTDTTHLMDSLPDGVRRELGRCFKALAGGEQGLAVRDRLTAAVQDVLELDPTS